MRKVCYCNVDECGHAAQAKSKVERKSLSTTYSRSIEIVRTSLKPIS